jgi:hypothetical protein
MTHLRQEKHADLTLQRVLTYTVASYVAIWMWNLWKGLTAMGIFPVYGCPTEDISAKWNIASVQNFKPRYSWHNGICIDYRKCPGRKRAYTYISLSSFFKFTSDRKILQNSWLMDMGELRSAPYICDIIPTNLQWSNIVKLNIISNIIP